MDKYFRTKISAVGNANAGTRAIWVAALFAEMGRLQEASALSSLSTHLNQAHVPTTIQGVTRWHDVIMSRSKPLIIIFTSAPQPLSCDLYTRGI